MMSLTFSTVRGRIDDSQPSLTSSSSLPSTCVGSFLDHPGKERMTGVIDVKLTPAQAEAKSF